MKDPLKKVDSFAQLSNMSQHIESVQEVSVRNTEVNSDERNVTNDKQSTNSNDQVIYK